MIKEIIAYILLVFGVIIAIIGTLFYLRMYKAMMGSNSQAKSKVEVENIDSVDYD